MEFSTVGIIIKKKSSSTLNAIIRTCDVLNTRGCKVIAMRDSSSFFPECSISFIDKKDFYKQADLLICIGGDGTLLTAAREVASDPKPLIGVNLGRLGFLVDIPAEKIEAHLTNIINGQYKRDFRTMLNVQVIRENECVVNEVALNDCVLHKTNFSRLIEFECYVNGQFFTSQRSDGLIISSPTGSTAYGLSAGGPIILPGLEVFSIVSICPHTISQRPVIVDDSSIIEINSNNSLHENMQISWDGIEIFSLQPKDKIIIKKHQYKTIIIQSLNHNHYQILRHKLRWGEKL